MDTIDRFTAQLMAARRDGARAARAMREQAKACKWEQDCGRRALEREWKEYLRDEAEAWRLEAKRARALGLQESLARRRRAQRLCEQSRKQRRADAVLAAPLRSESGYRSPLGVCTHTTAAASVPLMERSSRYVDAINEATREMVMWEHSVRASGCVEWWQFAPEALLRVPPDHWSHEPSWPRCQTGNAEWSAKARRANARWYAKRRSETLAVPPFPR